MIYQVHISKGKNDKMKMDNIYEAPQLLRSDIGDCLFFSKMVQIIVDAQTPFDAECMALFNARKILTDGRWGKNRLTNDECQP